MRSHSEVPVLIRCLPLVLLAAACGPLEPTDGAPIDENPVRAGDADGLVGDVQYDEPDPEPDAGDEPSDAFDARDVLPLDLPAAAAGSKMITKSYAGFHSAASDDSSLKSIPPYGGVADDALHPYRNPAGTIPPGHTVTLVSATQTNGFYKVTYADKTGWVKATKLAWRDPSWSRVKTALHMKNAFFKHQIHRSRWNKDGPMHSGNCAPTSLAMAANILGKEVSTHSVEQSIHRVRSKYDAGLHESDGTSLSEVHEAALDLGLNVHGMNTDMSPSNALARLNDQLAAGRLVVLFGQPGNPNSGPTAYEKAFNRAYADAIENGASLMHSTYNFNGHHAILVVGREGTGYVVADPISEVGMITLTATEMKDFMTRWSGNRGIGNAVWRS